MEKTVNAVAYDAVYPETVGTQPFYAFMVVTDFLIAHELMPQYFVAECILYLHQTEVLSPISCIYVDHNIPVL